MTLRELNRAEILIEISKNKLSQVEAAKILGLSVRQIQRLCVAFKRKGIAVLASRKRGKPSNHQLPSVIRARVLELVTCEKYAGFGPTFMCEKLGELHGIRVS